MMVRIRVASLGCLLVALPVALPERWEVWDGSRGTLGALGALGIG